MISHKCISISVRCISEDGEKFGTKID
jgi:hypothetical protein